MQRLIVLTPLVAILTLVAAACGGGGGEPQRDGAVESEIFAQVATQDLVVGPNRFALGLFDAEQNLILKAQVNLRFFKLSGDDQEVLKAELPAQYIGLESNFVHEHPEGTSHVHGGPEVGLYVVYADFDSAGVWAAEAAAIIDGEAQEPVRAHFQVLEETAVPNIGDAAPRSRQLTLANVSELSEIDTSAEPIPEMHELTIADALDAGKPVVITFATPAFCVSRLCGPVKSEVVDAMFREYQDEVAFVHVEPYDVPQARETGQLVPVEAMTEWGLPTEPWVFVVDRDGRIAARFEGVLSVEELRQAIEATLS